MALRVCAPAKALGTREIFAANGGAGRTVRRLGVTASAKRAVVAV